MEIFQMRTFGHPRCFYERSRTQNEKKKEKKKVRALVCELSSAKPAVPSVVPPERCRARPQVVFFSLSPFTLNHPVVFFFFFPFRATSPLLQQCSLCLSNKTPPVSVFPRSDDKPPLTFFSPCFATVGNRFTPQSFTVFCSFCHQSCQSVFSQPRSPRLDKKPAQKMKILSRQHFSCLLFLS